MNKVNIKVFLNNAKDFNKVRKAKKKRIRKISNKILKQQI